MLRGSGREPVGAWLVSKVVPGLIVWVITGAFPFGHKWLLKRHEAALRRDLKSSSEDGEAKP